MAKTSCEIEFEAVDITAKGDGAVAVNDSHELSDPQDLTKETIKPPVLATLEPNAWALDGGTTLYDPEESAEYGWWSADMCGSTGDDGWRRFDPEPTLTITFTTNHTTNGLTFTCYGDSWPDHMTVKWYNATGAVIAQQSFFPDGLTFFCGLLVENFRKIVVTFRSMSKPNRYLKLARILYGQVLNFGGGELTAATIQEELDPISAELTINTVSFTVRSGDDGFNAVNPSGLYRALQQRQPIVVREVVGVEIKQLGTYYLNEWNTDDEEGTTLKGVDSVGLLDMMPFAGGLFDNETALNVAMYIFVGSGIPFSVDPVFDDQRISGWLGAGTKREALQQLAFRLGAVVKMWRDGTVHITSLSETPTETIGRSRKWQGQKLEVLPLVTGVEVTTHSFNGAGEDTQTVVGHYMEDIPANTAPNVLRVTDAMLVGPADGATVAKRVYDHYQRRYRNTLTIQVGNERAGTGVTVDSYYDRTIAGVVEAMEIDLVGGFVAEIEVVGTVTEAEQ